MAVEKCERHHLFDCFSEENTLYMLRRRRPRWHKGKYKKEERVRTLVADLCSEIPASRMPLRAGLDRLPC